MSYRILAIAALAWWLAGCGREDTPASANTAAPRAQAPAATGDVVLPADSPKLSRIRIEPVHEALVALDEVVAPGKIEADPNRISRIAMPVAGRVRRVGVAIGDAVKQGDPLLWIDSPDAGTAVSAFRQAQAKLSQAQAALVKADADYTRAQDLFANQAIAQKEVINARAALAQAKADVEQSQAGYDEVVRRLQILGVQPGDPRQEIVIRAPVSGKVLEMSVAAGEYRNDTSAPLLTIADLNTVFMTGDVPESRIRLVTVGEQVDITLDAFPGEVLHGKVYRIADTVDPQTRTVRVRALLANPRGRLRPEMFGQIRHEETFRRVPVVPPGAVIQSGEESAVFREKSPGTFELTPVAFGKREGDLIPITKGLRAGDRVVTDGAMLLKGR